jgi:site-specific DNA-cytosine methylase
VADVEHTFTVATPFGGCGGGALGAQRAVQTFRGLSGRVELLGGYDSDPYACKAFRYLTGVEEACVDARALTPEDVIRLWGPTAPWAFISSPPCVGATALISHAKASTEHYVEMNELMLPSTRTILEAYGPDPNKLPAYFIFENVPGLGSDKRGGGMLKKLFALFRSYKCFAVHQGHHNARHVGGGAQNRVRLLIVVRNIVRVPVFLHKPPYQEGLVVGDVLGPLPLPDDPRGGPMHGTTRRMSFLNRLRLWAIEAGKDWRSLRDRTDALAMKVPKDAHANLYRVADEKEASPVVTCATRPGGGALSVADSRVPVELAPTDAGWHDDILGVLAPKQVAGTVTRKAGPTTGRFSIAAPVPVELVPDGTAWNHGILGVLDPQKPSGAVTGEGRPMCGRFAVADERVPIDLVPKREPFSGAYGVLDGEAPAGAVTREAAPSTGSFAIAAPVPVDLSMPEGTFQHANAVAGWTSASGTVTTSPAPSSGGIAAADPRVPIDLRPQPGNENLHENKYAVRPWNGHAKAVTTATRVGSGAQSVAQPLDLETEAFRGSYGVLSLMEPSGAVKRNAFPTTGPYSVAAPVPVDLVPGKDCFDAGYGVLAKDQPSRAIAATSAVGCGAYAIADEVPRAPLDLGLTCEPHAGAYGVQGFDRAAKTVLAQGCIDNTTAAVADPRETPRYLILTYEQVERIVSGETPIPFAIVDPARPDVPLAIVDDLKKPAYRIVRSTGPRGRVIEKRVPVTIVLVSRDDTWHRELTTLELAVLQSFPWQHHGVPLDFGGGTTEQRGIIGNAIPPTVMEAVFKQILISSLASAQSFFLAPSDWDVWVQGLHDEGYEILDAGHRPVDFGGGVVLDDGAVVRRKRGRRMTRSLSVPMVDPRAGAPGRS